MADVLENMEVNLSVLQTMKVAELRKELKARRLPVTGNKTELIERLQEAIGLQKDQPNIDDKIGSVCLEGLENLEAGDDVNEDEVLSDDVLYGEEQKGTETTEIINEEDILSPIPSSEQITPPKNSVKLQRKPPPILNETLQESKVQIDDSSDKSVTIEKEIDKNSLSETDKKKVVISTKNMTQEERLALRAKRFSNGTDSPKLNRTKRFGTTGTSKTENNTVQLNSGSIGSAPVDLDCLKKRAERFGQNVSTVMKQIEEKSRILKRKERFGASAVIKTDGNEEIEEKSRILKRKERFGSPSVTKTDGNEEERKKKRAERFNLT